MSRQQAGTPALLFKTLQEEYSFDCDICACDHNAKLSAYLTKEDDALSSSWEGLRVWCNPPYNNIPVWLAHAPEPVVVAYLLPARTDRWWWRRWKPLSECHYFVGEKPHARVAFEPPPGITYSSNPDCNVLLLFGEGTTPGAEVWRSGRTGERL